MNTDKLTGQPFTHELNEQFQTEKAVESDQMNVKKRIQQDVKERLLQAIQEWDVNRLRSELEMFIRTSDNSELVEMYFDDVATEEEMNERFREIELEE